MNDIVSYLFKTNAIKFCPENKPFWLTSGKISPYFINTQFLYGSETEATEFLSYIDTLLSKPIELPQKVFEKVLEQYKNNSIYKTVIDEMKDFIEENIDVSQVDYISGGERRDWFFSNIIAYLLDKPHLTLFKDTSCIVSDSKFTKSTSIDNINNAKVLHIADLITIASSYENYWVPAVKKLGGQTLWSAVIVDRVQGGEEKLKSLGIKSLSIVKVNLDLFKTALNQNIINQSQFNMLEKFFENPDDTMRNFLINHPEFIENSLNSDPKTAKRAKLCIDSNIYNLK